MTSENLKAVASATSHHSSETHRHENSVPVVPHTDGQDDLDNKGVGEKGSAPLATASATPGRPRKYSHGFFDPELAGLRKVAFKILVPYTVIIIVIMWATLSVFWASFYHAPTRSNRLSIAVFDLDTQSLLAASDALPSDIPTLGQYITQACLANANGSTTGGSHRGTLGYWAADTSEYDNLAAIENAVVQERFWAAVVIPAGTTSGLLRARQNGNISWAPSDAVLFVYNQARNENAAGSYIVPIGQAVLTRATASWSALSAGQYLRTAGTNQTALQALIAAPQTLSPGASYRAVNLRNFGAAPTAPAATLVGGIFIVVFSFFLVNAFGIVRDIVGPFLRTKQYIAFRMIVPAVLYLFVSLSISMLNLPFKVPFDAHFSYGTGWFVWWMACYCTMMACGLALEFWVTILTPKFTPFMMLFIILYQVSTVSLPHELQVSFYSYGIGVPLNRSANILRTILFDTKDEIAMGFGVLLAWMFLSWFITLPLITWIYRRKDLKAFHKEQESAEAARA